MVFKIKQLVTVNFLKKECRQDTGHALIPNAQLKELTKRYMTANDSLDTK